MTSAVEPDLPDLPGLFSAVDSLKSMMALHSRDWGVHGNDAWMYGIVLGWDGDPDEPGDDGTWQLLADRHGWNPATLDRLKALHRAVQTLTIDAISDTMRTTERALPEPEKVSVEYSAWCHGPESTDAIRLSQDQFGFRERAVKWAESRIGRDGIAQYTIRRREHHYFPDGSRFESASTPWVLDEEPVTP